MIIVLLVFFLFLPLFCLLVIQLIPLGRCPLSCSSFSSFDYWNDSSCSIAIVPCLSYFWFLWLLIAHLLMAPICEGSITFFPIIIWMILLVHLLLFLVLLALGFLWLLMAPHLWRERCISFSLYYWTDYSCSFVSVLLVFLVLLVLMAPHSSSPHGSYLWRECYMFLPCIIWMILLDHIFLLLLVLLALGFSWLLMAPHLWRERCISSSLYYWNDSCCSFAIVLLIFLVFGSFGSS